VVQEQQEGSEVKSLENNRNFDRKFASKFCRCESWPLVSSRDEVDVDAPVLLTADAGRELCVECGLQVISPLHQVLLSILQDRDKTLTPPTDGPPPLPVSHPPLATPTSSEAEDVGGVSDRSWSPGVDLAQLFFVAAGVAAAAKQKFC
jgi:hypothetical protein